MLSASEGLGLIPLAVDPCVDFRRDLMDQEALLALLLECREGHVAAVLASPPCSTFSRARPRRLAGGAAGPRPLRGRRDPFVLLPGLTEKELEAGRLGSHLALACMLLLWEAGRRGAWTGLEHPADPGRAHCPSFFHSSEM